MLICINLETFHVLVTTYLSYKITGKSESSNFEIQVLRTELFWATFKSRFLTSFFPKGDFLYQILSPGFNWCLFNWFIHLCKMMAFEYFLVSNRTAFMVNCLRSVIKHSSSRRLVQAATDFGCSLRFPHKIFIPSFRIVLRRKRRLTENFGTYFWLETKLQGKQQPGNTLQRYLFWSPNYRSVKQLSTSVFLTSRVACGWWTLPYSTSDAVIRI